MVNHNADDELDEAIDTGSPSAAILDLNTIAPTRHTIRIDGRAYELAVWGDLGLKQRAQLQQYQDIWNACQAIDPESEEPASAEEITAVENAMEILLPIIIRGSTPELIAKLGEPGSANKLAIFEVFTDTLALNGTIPATPAAQVGSPSLPITPPSSAGSRDSTRQQTQSSG